jgi:alpha 1,2-mannosyltransferase
MVSEAESAVPVKNPEQRAQAAIVVLARDSDLDGVLLSMQRMEARFNSKFGYPYVFLNNEAFGPTFISRYVRFLHVCLRCVPWPVIPTDHQQASFLHGYFSFSPYRLQ